MKRLTHVELIVMTGISGSGKSVAVAALEDAGYYCVDNLPPELLLSLVELQATHDITRIAVAVDVRSALSLPALPAQLEQLKAMGAKCRKVFLEATDETLLRRFSETRRQHPLSRPAQEGQERQALVEALHHERELLADVREGALVLDTSHLKPADLRSQIQQVLGIESDQITLVFESFAFKRGLPMDADFVFDVRMLPNPHYEPTLRLLTGRDAPVANYLAEQDSVGQMLTHIAEFLTQWLPAMRDNHRSYVTVAIGCTGGQHRSVYLVEQLARRFSPELPTQIRHRMLDMHA